MAVRERVNEHRRRMRERGYRLVRTWVPDVHSGRFAAARRQAQTVDAAQRRTDDQDFIASVSVAWEERSGVSSGPWRAASTPPTPRPALIVQDDRFRDTDSVTVLP